MKTPLHNLLLTLALLAGIHQATAQTISGTVTDTNASPVTNVTVYAFGTGYYSTNTDGSGNYSFNVTNGSWYVELDCDNLNSLGYQCANYQIVNISNINSVVNFSVTPCGAPQIITTFLPAGEVNNAYYQVLQASTCGNFTWSLNSGTLPPGLQLDSYGELFGNPGTNGTFNFTVQVSSGGHSTNQSLSLTIISPIPVLSAPVQASVGKVQFSLQGNAANYYTIEFSTNLINWLPVLVTNPPNAQPFNLIFPTTNKDGFYRAYESGIAIAQSDFSFGTGVVGTPVFYVNVTNGVAIIPITRTNGLSTSACVNYSTSDGTAIAGCDYEPVSGTLCFAAGVTSNSISIPIPLVDCNTNQSFTVNLLLGDTNGVSLLNAILVIQRPPPVLAVFPTSLALVVPDNCEQDITISNAGPQGSVLNYTVADDGALGGFLNLNPDYGYGQESSSESGSLQAGQTAQVAFTVLDRFATNWIGGTLTTAPSIYTPGAANYVKYPLSVTIETDLALAQNLLGTWNGTWSGTNYSPDGGSNSIPTSGTWSLTFQQIISLGNYSLNPPTYGDVVGTITWQGTAYYWPFDSATGKFDLPPHAFSFNQTAQFNNSSFIEGTAEDGPNSYVSITEYCGGITFGVYGDGIVDSDNNNENVFRANPIFIMDAQSVTLEPSNFYLSDHYDAIGTIGTITGSHTGQ